MKPKTYKGGCLCGSIRFCAIGPAAKPHTCSCRMCRQHTGSLTACWVEFEKGSVTWTGPGGPPTLFRSSEYSNRAFCPVCGSSIGAVDDALVIAVLLGAFDKPGAEELAPVSHSYRGKRPKWWHVSVSQIQKVHEPSE
ncbi:GFA family protein [Pseudorhizobium halotolerans]|uniref:GFA family protein n=1 Tax=Pseudorhizobium halotolerans TaxID=1233081 RepID=UPI0011589103|nr:GFA family protein [Pseudorhizobium halotolerans]MCA0344218.1 GFA family protein [Pseudomonadota bacterium]